MMNKAVILFTRVPIAGQTKTRLQPFLSADQCAQLHKAFLKDIYAELRLLHEDILVSFTPDNECEKLRCILGDDIRYFPQTGNDLGKRMQNAIAQTLNQGYKSCVLIGSDVPLLKSEDIQCAFESLDTHDFVISPTEDGGYYLIGMKKACPNLFALSYGTQNVFEKTCAVMEAEKKTFAVGSKQFDIDNKADLCKLADQLAHDSSEKNIHTKAMLSRIFAQKKRGETHDKRSY